MYIRISTIALAFLITFNFAAKAQSDTTIHEVGRVNLPKKFTQSVTIKATELEKIPFTNISDVITTWLYGYYGDRKSYVYVVDGLLNTDVNAFSIFDIDEITMVQNAAVYINGALPGQVLLLVKTKRNTKPGTGVMVSGQTNLVNQRNTYPGSTVKSTTNVYNHYYLGAYKNSGAVSAGISASFQHNPYPLFVSPLGDRPYNINRFKFNGYLTAKLGNSNLLNITAGYVPQSDDMKIATWSIIQQGGIINMYEGSGNQNSLYANISLTSNLGGGFVNKLNVGYQSRKTNMSLFQKQEANQFIYPTTYTITNTNKTDSSSNAKSVIISDDLSYNFRIGKISIRPNVNFTYKNVTDNATRFIAGTSTQGGGQTYSNSREGIDKSSISLLTPSLTFNYADMVLLQGGFQKHLNKDLYSRYKVDRLDALPFVNLGVDALKIANVKNTRSSLMLSASYAKALGIIREPYLPLSDQIVGLVSNTYPYLPGTDIGKTFDQFQAGLSYSILNGRLSFSYNHQLIKTSEPILFGQYYPPAYTFYQYIVFDRKINLDRVEVNAEILNKGNFKWLSTLNASLIRSKLIDENKSLSPISLYQLTTNIVTGGFINRLTYNKVSAGLDVLYCFNQERYNGVVNGELQTGKYNSFNLQNLYVGYNFKALKGKDIEVYANLRNMFMNPNSTITNNFRFYGLGFNAKL